MNEDQRVARALRESPEVATRILEAVPGGVVVVARNGAVVRANAEAIRVLGLSYDELQRRFVNDFDPETIWEDGSPCRAEHYPVSRCLQTGRPQGPATVGVRQRSGEIAWAVFRAIPLRDPLDDDLLGSIVTFLDITERRQEEERRLRLEARIQQAQKLESLEALAGGVAHDFNNLLQSVLGHAELAMQALGDGGRLRHSLETIRSTSLRASELTQQLLTYSGRSQLKSEPLDLGRLIREMVRLLQAGISRRASLELDLVPELPAVRGDATRLRQVAMNLITNASEALQDEPGTIAIRTGTVAGDGLARPAHPGLPEPAADEYVFFEVEDSGCGMEPETTARMFEPFFSTKGAGRGLGLAAVLGIVRSHGGLLELESEPRRGSRLRVLLPATADPVVEVAPANEQPARRAGRHTILVAEDEPDILSVMTQSLEQQGYEVIATGSGREALAELGRRLGDVDLVIVDFLMPDLNGGQVLSRLRELRPDLPAILCSGYSDVAAANLLPGVAAFLQKPFRMQLLVTTIQQILVGSSDSGQG